MVMQLGSCVFMTKVFICYTTENMKITIYTDGSSRGNPGPGGWGCILITESKQIANGNEQLGEVVELGGREDMTTNNRMELMATIEGLRHINGRQKTTDIRDGLDGEQAAMYRPQSIEICTDSEYVKKGMTEWIKGWIQKGWKTSTKKDVLNRDLWEQLLHEVTRLKDAHVVITWKYVRGHTGIPGNERADAIATGCADNATHLQLYRGEKSAYPFF